MIIDVHAHYHPKAYTDALARMPEVRGGPLTRHAETDDPGHLQARLEMMEAAGVGLQVLSPAAVLPVPPAPFKGTIKLRAKDSKSDFPQPLQAPKGAPNIDAAYALIDFLLTPAINVVEGKFHGYPLCDSRAIAMMPKELIENPVLYPAAESLAPLEFGAAATLTNPLRAEIMARFKAA